MSAEFLSPGRDVVSSPELSSRQKAIDTLYKPHLLPHEFCGRIRDQLNREVARQISRGRLSIERDEGSETPIERLQREFNIKTTRSEEWQNISILMCSQDIDLLKKMLQDHAEEAEGEEKFEILSLRTELDRRLTDARIRTIRESERSKKSRKFFSPFQFLRK